MNPTNLAANAITASKGDLDEADARLLLMEEQLRQHCYVKYFEPCGDQLQFWKQLRPEQKIWLILGGNGAGKSILLAFLTVAWILGKEYFRGAPAWKWVEPLPIPEPPLNVRVVGLTEGMLADPVWENLFGATDHPPMVPNDGSLLHQSEHKHIANWKNHSRLQGKMAQADPNTHGGANCALVAIDEECSLEIFEENYQRTRKDGHILVGATPLADVGTIQHPWIFDYIQKWQEGDPEIGVVYLSMDNNPYLSDDHKRKQHTRYDNHPMGQARLYGRPVRRSGLYYHDWKPEAPLFVPEHDLESGGTRVVCIDPAATGPVGALWANFDAHGNMTLYREYKERKLNISEHVTNILLENRGEPIDIWLMDPFRARQAQEGKNETVLQLWQRGGLPRLRPASTDYDVALARSREYMKAAHDTTDPHPRVEIFDHLSKLRAELDRYVVDSVVQGPRRGETIDRPRKGNSDLIECYQYLSGMGLRAHRRTRVQLVPARFRCHTAT